MVMTGELSKDMKATINFNILFRYVNDGSV